MTSGQYNALLQELAHVAGLADASALLDSGRLKIGEMNALLQHDPTYDANLLQVRIALGEVAQEQQGILMKALLEANYVHGYGGECVFSLFPDSADAVLTMRLDLQKVTSPHDLWQELSDIGNHAQKMWQEIAPPPSGLHLSTGMHIREVIP